MFLQAHAVICVRSEIYMYLLRRTLILATFFDSWPFREAPFWSRPSFFHEIISLFAPSRIHLALSFRELLRSFLSHYLLRVCSCQPRIATIILCSVNFVASFASILTVRMFGRRTLLIWGQAGSAVCLLLIGFFTIIGFNYGVLGMIFMFVFIY